MQPLARSGAQTTREIAAREHLTIVSILPDFVLGTVDEASQQQVERHLRHCEVCRAEYDGAMAALSQLSPVPPPAPWVRGAILRRAAALPPSASSTSSPSRTGSALGREPRRPWRPGTATSRWVLAAASAIIFLIASGISDSDSHGFSPMADTRLAGLLGNSAAAYPLDDSDIPTQATGVIFAEPKDSSLFLVANGLPALPGDQRYQVWLFTTDDELVSAGQVAVSPDGAIRQVLQTPGPFASYVGVALTAEPTTGSPAPTSDMVLGGSLPPPSDSLPLSPELLAEDTGSA